MRITNAQIYEYLTKQLAEDVSEVKATIHEINGRVRKNSEAVVVALDRTKRIGEELDHHCDDDDAHGGGSAKVTANAEIKVALIGMLAGIGGGLVSRLPDLLGK